MTEDLVGASLAHFRVDRKLGQGGMGVVYAATDEKLRRQVALKVLPDGFARDEERKRRFLREARSAAAITDANIATVYEVGEAQGRVFIAMELVEGESLRGRLARGAPPIGECLRIARQIARGLGKAHERGLVHRDLKPDNVMLTADGDVKILDFGLAKLHEADAGEPSALEQQETASMLTREGIVFGTPAYMSPEQALGKAVGARSDVFSFGVVLYELVTGARPFVGGTAAELLVAVTRDEPEAPSKRNAAVGEAVEQVIARCLAKTPDDRYANARELLTALDAASEARSTRDPPRRRATSARTLLVLAAVAATGAGVAALATRDRAANESATRAATSTDEPPPSASVVTRVTLPVPATDVPAARTEYIAGLQLERDDNVSAASEHYRRAATLDPSMAAAHLRLALMEIFGSPMAKRDAYARAASLRSKLTARDQAVLEAFEPVIGRALEDIPEAVRRVRAVLERTPDDVELLEWLAFLAAGQPDVAIPAARRATEIDESDARAWDCLGTAYGFAGREEDARRAYARCAELAPRSEWAPWEIANLDAASGRCEEYERDARRAADADANLGLRDLAEALVAVGRPPGAVHEVNVQLVAAQLGDGARDRTRLSQEAALAVHAGHFDDASRLLAEVAVSISQDSTLRPSFDANLSVATRRFAVLAESGEDAKARDIAREFSDKMGALVSSAISTGGADRSLWLARVANGPSRDLEQRRGAWIDTLLANGVAPSLVWANGWALPAMTPQEAATAVDALQRDPRLSAPRGSESAIANVMNGGNADAAAGHAYLLAGRAADALPYLRRASRTCWVLYEAVSHVQATVDLGRALEATGDAAGACAAYARVLDAWGRATPRSVSASTARARIAALRCGAANAK